MFEPVLADELRLFCRTSYAHPSVSQGDDEEVWALMRYVAGSAAGQAITAVQGARAAAANVVDMDVVMLLGQTLGYLCPFAPPYELRALCSIDNPKPGQVCGPARWRPAGRLPALAGSRVP